MGRHLFFFSVLLLLSSFGLASCSVKEDRSVCPSLLTLRIERNSISDALDSVTVFIYAHGSDEPVVCSRESVEDLVAGIAIFEVPRVVGLDILVLSDGSGMVYSGSVLCAGGAGDCPELFDGFTSLVIAPDAETADAVVRLRKDYARVTIIFHQSEITDCRLVVTADYDGVSVPSGDAVKGDFRFICRQTGEDTYEVRLPRQKDDSEIIVKADGVSVSTLEEVFYGFFDLATPLLENGYDWSEENLKDAVVVIGNDMMLLGVTVHSWEDQHFNPDFN